MRKEEAVLTTFTICIASHGSSRWKRLAEHRALPSAEAQGVPVLIRHDPNGTRAQVRNELANEARTDYLIFLDADDELEPGYVAFFERALEGVVRKPWGPLLVPAVSYVEKGGKQEPMFWPVPELDGGNWIVVGAGVERDLFQLVGGWRTFMGTGVLNEYDDWDLWIRCQLAGARPVPVEDSVYVAHIARSSPHRTQRLKIRKGWTQEIRHANWPERYP